jgi:hypothetical protein
MLRPPKNTYPLGFFLLLASYVHMTQLTQGSDHNYAETEGRRRNRLAKE